MSTLRVLALIPILSITLGAQEDWAARIAEGREATNAAIAAMRDGDNEGYLSNMQAATGLRPNHPTLVYHLARAQILNDRLEAAESTVVHLAAMGVGLDVSRDTLFNSLASRERYAAALAQLRSNTQPVVRSDTVAGLEDIDYQPEGIVKLGDQFLLGSVHKGLITGTSSGRWTDAELWSVMGMAATSDRVWAVTTATPEGGHADLEGASQLVGFDWQGREQVRYDSPVDGLSHWFGDLTVSPTGQVYVSDSRAPGVFVLRGEQLVPLRTGAPYTSPQGIAWAHNRLYLADYSAGVFMVDPASGSSRLLPAPSDASLLGIDGMYAYSGDLLAIQNGMAPTRIVRLRLNASGDRITAVDVLEAAHPAHDDPTLGVVSGDTLYYVPNSQWPKFSPDSPDPDRTEPLVLGLPLRHR